MPQTRETFQRTMHGTGFVLAGLVLVGAVARILLSVHRSFSPDEFLHVFSAEQWLHGGQPLLPSGLPYPRAWAFTWLVRESFRFFGVSEWSARLPSVLAGVLTILAVFWIGRRWFSRAAGLVAAGLVAWSPFALISSANCRMYAWVQLTFLVLVYAAYRALEDERGAWRWMAVSAGLLVLALHLQIIAITILPSIVLYAIGVVAVKLAREGPSVLWRSRHGWIVFGALLAGIGLLTIGRPLLEELWEQARSAPIWGLERVPDLRFYQRVWQELYPALWRLAPLAALWLFVQRGRLGWFLSLVFVVPFILHSAVFGWKEQRFIHHLFPVFALLVTPFLVELVSRVGRWVLDGIQAATRTWRMAAARRAAYGVAVLCLLYGLYILGSPWVVRTAQLAVGRAKLPEEYIAVPWKSVYAALAGRLAPGDVLVTGEPLAALYYAKRAPAYVLNNHHLTESFRAPRQQADGWYYDAYSGAPLIRSLDEFARVLEQAPRGWIVTDRARFLLPASVPVELREFIVGQTEEIVLPGLPSVICRRWGGERLAAAQGQGASR